MGKKQRNRLVQTDTDGTTHYLREDVEETAAPEEQKQEAPQVAFDAWWSLRSAAIPAVHKKEIIKADFLARKISMISSMAEFDEALKKYGVKLA